MKIFKGRIIVKDRTPEQSSPLIMLLLVITMASTITVPYGSNFKSFFDALAGVFPFIRETELTNFFHMYNIIGISSLCLIAVLIRSFLFSGSKTITLSFIGIFLVFWAMLQILYCILYMVFSAMLWQPILLLCIYVLFKQPEYKERFINVAIGVGVANALLTIVQFVYFGIDSSVFAMIRIYRPAAFFPDATLSAIYMSLTVSFILFCKQISKQHSIFMFAVLVVGCILNGSRVALVLILIAVILSVFREFNGRKAAVLTGLFILCLGILLVSDSLQTNVFDAVNSFLADDSRGLRREIAMNLFMESPLFGTGLNEYENAAGVYGLGSTVHNIYAMVLCKYGLIGFTLFIIPLIAAIILGYNNSRFAMCLLIMLAVGASVSGVESSMPIQIVWYYAYSSVYSQNQTIRTFYG